MAEGGVSGGLLAGGQEPDLVNRHRKTDWRWWWWWRDARVLRSRLRESEYCKTKKKETVENPRGNLGNYNDFHLLSRESEILKTLKIKN